MIHIFHGFLGSPEDFKFLEGHGVTVHDLYSNDFNPEIKPDDTIIGYSMGGRIALELASRSQFNIKKIILINSHPGLSTEEDKDVRRIWEDSILGRLETMESQEFYRYWNSLPIFESDLPLTPIEDSRFLKSKELFHKFRLSNQENYLPLLKKHKEKVQWVVGLKDQKYKSLAHEILEPNDIKVTFADGGHRLFQNHSLLLEVLKKEDVP